MLAGEIEATAAAGARDGLRSRLASPVRTRLEDPNREAPLDELATSARAQWLSTMPAISAMIDVIGGTAAIGQAASNRRAAGDARTIARRLHRRGGSSFYAVTGLRLWAQAAHLLGERTETRDVLARAAALARERGGNVDRLAIRALGGETIDPGPLGSAIVWSTGGMIDGEHEWHLR